MMLRCSASLWPHSKQAWIYLTSPNTKSQTYQLDGQNTPLSFGRPANPPLIGVGFDYNPKFTFDVSDSKTEQDNTSGYLRVRLPFFVLSAVWPVHTIQHKVEGGGC